MLVSRPVAKSIENTVRTATRHGNSSAALVLTYITVGVIAPFALPLKSTMSASHEESQ